MTNKPRASHDELGSIPLLRGFSASQLEHIIDLCEPAEVHEGVLFEAGEPAEAFYLLTGGTVILWQDNIETHKLHPLVIIGELGALTGRDRNSKAMAGEDAEVWQIRVARLRALFERDKELGLRFQQNLIDVVTDKIHRDQVRLRDMRGNIVHTQKAMKRMREFLLESRDTVVSNPIHEVLDGLIKRNRRVNYHVDPPAALAAVLRMDNDTEAPVVRISRTDITVQGAGGSQGERISGVLSLSGPEIPVSGKITRTGEGQVDIHLDLLLDEYIAELEGYLTRVQMLDFLV